MGLKEVRPDLLGPTNAQLRPKKAIVLVRDLRDAATSLVEKTERDANASYDDKWIRNYLTESPRAILNLLQELDGSDHRVLRYEDLVQPETRTRLATWLDWPLDGQAGRHLAELFNRSPEVELHAGDITGLAIGRRTRTEHNYATEIADWAAQENAAFQRKFGYTV